MGTSLSASSNSPYDEFSTYPGALYRGAPSSTGGNRPYARLWLPRPTRRDFYQTRSTLRPFPAFSFQVLPRRALDGSLKSIGYTAGEYRSILPGRFFPGARLPANYRLKLSI